MDNNSPLDQPDPPVSGNEGAAPPAEEPRSSRSALGFGLVVAAAVLLLFVAVRFTSKQTVLQGPRTTMQNVMPGIAPDFALKDIHGNTVRLSDLRGKVVILDFWATWCPPCKIEIPWFIDLHDQYKSQGLEVVGIAMDDEGVDAVKPFAEKYNMNYRILIGNDEVATKFGGIFGLPTTFVIDREGRVQEKHVGLVSRSTFEEAVKKLL